MADKVAGGGCGSRAKYTHGSFFRECCGEFKEISDFVISRVCGADWEKNQIIMETRSQKEMMNILEKTGFTFKKEK